MPPQPAPTQASARGAGNPLVPKVPESASPKLALGRGQTQAAGGNAPVKNIPIRNLAPPPPKKKHPLVKVLIILVVLAVVGLGGYYGFQWLSAMQEKTNAKRRAVEKNSDGGQVGHIADLNAVLDATEPGGRGLGSLKERRASAPPPRETGVGQEIPLPGGAGPGEGQASAPAEKPLPVIPAVYTLEVESAKIPEGKVNGMISGTNFVAETVRLDAVAGAQVLRFTQGALASPDREILAYLHLKAGEKLEGQKITIAKDTRASGMPTITKRWKPNPKYAPKQQPYANGFAMKLELGQAVEGFIPGKVYIALPDPEQSVIAGVFKAASSVAATPDGAVPTAAPAPATPSMSPSERANFERRYGTRP